MIVKYRPRRSDIWYAYWFALRHSLRLKLLWLVVFTAGFIVAKPWYGVTSTVGRLAVAGAIAVGPMFFLPVYAMLRMKTDERVLSMSPSGISTTIGKLTGDVPWAKVRRIVALRRCLCVLGTTGNVFVIPSCAFSTDADRVAFLAQATRWWNEAKGLAQPMQPPSGG